MPDFELSSRSRSRSEEKSSENKLDSGELDFEDVESDFQPHKEVGLLVPATSIKMAVCNFQQ